ncbi:MAG TPA: ATP-binding protein [Steroidobacteraceae bacterium]|jgi:signal transduction histidine kinase
MSTIKSSDEFAVSLEERLAAALAAHIARKNELHLGSAYELGRDALEQGWSIPELVTTHNRALRAVIAATASTDSLSSSQELGDAFLAESLSSFEMTHRGYREALIGMRHLNETLEREVKRIAHSLHDGAGQLLVSAHLALAELEIDCLPAARPGFRRVRELLEEIEHQLRNLSHELRPTMLDDLGWLPAIEFLAEGISKRAQLPIHVRSSVSGRLPSRIEIVLYRSVQEALTNASRHARANCVNVEVSRDADILHCLIKDDGIGFDVASHGGGGLGLIGMRERLSAANGTLQITSTPGTGTQVRLELPIEV